MTVSYQNITNGNLDLNSAVDLSSLLNVKKRLLCKSSIESPFGSARAVGVIIRVTVKGQGSRSRTAAGRDVSGVQEWSDSLWFLLTFLGDPGQFLLMLLFW